MKFEKEVRKEIINALDEFFNILSDTNFRQLNNEEDVTEEEADRIESIFMSYRNVIAGTEWDGERREYETYEVR